MGIVLTLVKTGFNLSILQTLSIFLFRICFYSLLTLYKTRSILILKWLQNQNVAAVENDLSFNVGVLLINTKGVVIERPSTLDHLQRKLKNLNQELRKKVV